MSATGLQAPVTEVGDIDVRRDFLHVSDVIEAYLILLERAEPGGIYNICSGSDHRLRDLLHRLQELAGTHAKVRQDETRLRPAEQRVARGNPDRLRALGWKPSVPMDVALEEILVDWKSRVGTP